MKNWLVKANGVWSYQYGDNYPLKPLSIAQVIPRHKEIDAKSCMKLPIQMDDLSIETSHNRTIIRIPLQEDEKIYGLGLHFFKMNHRGRTRYLRVNSDPKQDTGETHAPIGFYVTNKGYGLLINTAKIITIYCGSTNLTENQTDRNKEKDWLATPKTDMIEIVLSGDNVELIAFAGESMLDIISRYNLYCGGGVLPPKWGLGFWHRVPTNYNSEQVKQEALEFRKRGYPCDVIGLEPGWHSYSYPCSFEWSNLYKNPKEFIKFMTDNNFHINLWEHPYVSKHSQIYEPLKTLSSSHTVWGGLVPDITLEECIRIIKEKHEKEHIDIGISGYKIDECDGSELTGSSWMFPAHAQFPSGYDGEEMRQIYGLAYQKLTNDIYKKRNQRTYGLVRASNAGSSNMPYVLYSDLYDHKQFVRALCNSSFSGILWCPEIRSATNEADWVRRMQVVCFSPLAMLNAWSSGTKPWSYLDVEDIVKKYINLRMRLMPYLYTAFAQYYHNGIPPFRAVELDINDEDCKKKNNTMIDLDKDAYGIDLNHDLDDQFMVGEYMMVTPLFGDDVQREVYLPLGNWYEFETGIKHIGGKTILVEAQLDTMPIFIKEGGVIPLMPTMQHMPNDDVEIPINILHYGDCESEYTLYDDDGTSFNYQKGEYIKTQISIQKYNNEFVYSRNILHNGYDSKYKITKLIHIE